MAELLKHNVDQSVVELLADQAQQIEPSFDRIRFAAAVEAELDDLELKDRINLVADRLADGLPSHYPTALDIVTALANGGQVTEWAAWPLCSFVERHGVDHPEHSLAAMPALTRRWSCEFAIRPFLQQHLDATRPHLRAWAAADDEHVRRLASEGTRPRLPWGPKVQALIDDPMIGIELLAVLRHDPSETVRRSVANHLNDVSRADPALVIRTLREWSDDEQPLDRRMVRHALRTLVKNGEPGALQLLGFTTEPEVDVVDFACDPTEISLGTAVELTATIRSRSDLEQKLAVDFVIHHVTADGSTAAKVFKWTVADLQPGETIELRKRRRIQNASTRTYQAGHHRVDLQVAGHRLGRSGFDLSLG